MASKADEWGEQIIEHPCNYVSHRIASRTQRRSNDLCDKLVYSVADIADIADIAHELHA